VSLLSLNLGSFRNVRAVENRIVHQSQVPLRVGRGGLSRAVVQDDLSTVVLLCALDVEAELRVSDWGDPKGHQWAPPACA